MTKHEARDRLYNTLLSVQHNGKECYGYEEVCEGQPPAPQIRARKEVRESCVGYGHTDC